MKLVHKSRRITAHFDKRVVGLEGEHRAPIIPKLAMEIFGAEPLLDSDIFELFFGRGHHFNHLVFDFIGNTESRFVVRNETFFPKSVLRIDFKVFVTFAGFVQDGATFFINGRNTAEQIPKTFHISFEFSLPRQRQEIRTPAVRISCFFRFLEDSNGLAGGS